MRWSANGTNTKPNIQVHRFCLLADNLAGNDSGIPGLTGSDLALKLLQLRPNLSVILCTGYSSIISEEKAKSLGIKGFAMKPLVRNEIALLIRELLDKKTAR